MDFQGIIKNYFSLKNIALIFVIFFSANAIYGQQTSNEQIKRVQRTIFIFNLAGQVAWPSSNDTEIFTIGVLGTDRTLVDLKSMALKRKIGGKPVEVVSFSSVKDINNIQVLYVNKNLNFDINYIIKHIHNKGILLISEDYNYNTSMINMVSVGTSFEYEINNGLLIAENFIVAPSLGEYAVTSAEKWKNLFSVTKKELEKEQQINSEKEAEILKNQTVISDKNITIDDQKNAIDTQVNKINTSEKLLRTQQDSLASLLTDNVLQAKKYEDKLVLEKELEKTITNQLLLVEAQREAITNSKAVLEAQQLDLREKELQIIDRQKTLDEQNLTIEDQRNTTILLGAIVGILLISGLLLFLSYSTKRKLAKELELKNIEATKQAKILASKNKELEQFAYVASHDLQEPLNSIISLIGILNDEYGDAFDDVGKQSLVFITESSNRMRELIKALLRHSKLGNIDAFKLVNTQKLLVNITKDLDSVISASNAEINFESIPTIMASEVELRLVFQNLITNAIKFIAPGVKPVINIKAVSLSETTETEKNIWQFSVSDNGIGIPQKYKERIFSIFQRLHSHDTYSGTGIGLAHVKKIIDAHGGDVWVNSEEGKGSTFYFTIPN